MHCWYMFEIHRVIKSSELKFVTSQFAIVLISVINHKLENITTEN